MLSDKIKNFSNTVLLFLMLMAVYSHYMVNDKFERTAPALVSVGCRHCIDWVPRAVNSRMTSGVFLSADGTTGDWLAAETKRSAIGDGERRRRQNKEARLSRIMARECVFVRFHVDPLDSTVSFLEHEASDHVTIFILNVLSLASIVPEVGLLRQNTIIRLFDE